MRAIERITIRPGDGSQVRRLRQLASVAAVVVLALLGAGCTGGGHSSLQDKPAGNAETKAAAASEVKITPANGVADINPSEGITVTAARGRLTNVTVHTSGDAVSGTFGPRNEVWHSHWALDVAQTYTVTATHRRRPRHRHHNEHIPHADAGPDVSDQHLRGVRPDLWRRHTDHPLVQPADHRQSRRRALAAAGDVTACDRRMVLGR